MQRLRGVFNTDQVNLDRIRVPASELMRADERHHRESLCLGIDTGLPSNIQHDAHRLTGWSRQLGVYIDSEMVRVLGVIETPETEAEHAALTAHAQTRLEHFNREGTEAFRDDLLTRSAGIDLQGGRFVQMEAAIFLQSGLAAELYPDLFTPSSTLVDKDGLVDYRVLANRMKEVQPGVFHDPDRDLLLFAHRFFRRSLSHRNKLNTNFLETFAEAARQDSALSMRLKLDPDALGHPASAQNLIELEYWRGPKYTDDISAIPNGVAEHKADERTKFYEGVDRTHVWWKEPETRTVSGESVEYRTFEVEELIENPSGGLQENTFGCRYAHAEYSAKEKALTHFDGAIRAYAGERYLERIDASIDRAGKNSDYTKLFRIDGSLSVSSWKRLLNDFFRGNKLIPEYLGAPVEDEKETEPSDKSPKPDARLAALIALQAGSIDTSLELHPELYQEIGSEVIPYVEIGCGAVAAYLEAQLDLSDVTTAGMSDGTLNMSRLSFGGPLENRQALFASEVQALADALKKDADGGDVRRAAIPLVWEDNGLLIALSIVGDANLVANVLKALPDVVDTAQPPSAWIEALSLLIKANVPRQEESVIWDGVDRGVLEIHREGVVRQRLRMPDALREHLVSSGKIVLKERSAEPEKTA